MKSSPKRPRPRTIQLPFFINGVREAQVARARRKRKPRHNPKLDTYVKRYKNLTAGQILTRLELKKSSERKKLIGQAKLPGLSTIKAAKKRTR